MVAKNNKINQVLNPVKSIRKKAFYIRITLHLLYFTEILLPNASICITNTIVFLSRKNDCFKKSFYNSNTKLI